MTGEQLLLALATGPVRLAHRDGSIAFRAPEGSLTEELREAIRANKEGLLAVLKERPGFVQLSPLSLNQLSMFFVHLFDPNSSAYNLALSMRLHSAVDVGRLREALALLVKRHEQLRATFDHVLIDDTALPCQFIADSLPPILEEHDGRCWTERELQNRAQAFYESPIDLRNGPIVHAGIFIRSERDCVLVVKLHHIVADGWSINIIVRDLGRFYRNIAREQASEGQELPRAYSEFSLRQRNFLAQAKGRERLAYWERLHTPQAPSLYLGGSGSRPATRRSLGATQGFEVDAALRSSLDDCARKLGTTTFALLLSVFQAFLIRRSGQYDLVVGVPTMGDRGGGFENTVGYFVNPVALRSVREPHLSFPEHAQRTSRELAEALDYRDVPFAALVERLGVARDASRTPVFQVMFHLLSKKMLGDVVDLLFAAPAETRVDFGGLTATSFALNQQEGQFDLTLEFVDRGQDMLGFFKYCTDLFDTQDVQEMIRDFQGLLVSVVSAPEKCALETAQRVRGDARSLPVHTPTKIVVASTFMAEGIREPLEFWFDRLRWQTELAFTHYGQVFQAVLDPSSPLRQNRCGFGVILFRFDDLRGSSDVEGPPAGAAEAESARLLEANVDELVRALEEGAPTMHVPLCVVLCPSSPGMGRSVADERRIAERTAERLRTIRGVHLLTPDVLFRWYPLETYSEPLGERLGHIPYTEPFMAILGTSIVRALHAITMKPAKALVVDCDGTLWNGVVGEDGPDAVVIEAPHRRLQEFLLEQRDAGVALCLCSKNKESDVWSVLENNPGMVLKREHVSFSRINWQPKSASLREMAAEMKIDLNAVIFIDDNALEREEVRVHCPSVLCAELPDDLDARVSYLEHFWPLDHMTITEEDRKRSDYYRSEGLRSGLRKGAASLSEFLERLQLVIDIHPAATSDYERMSQLSVRTNQFNTTARRLTVQQVAEYGSSSERSAFVADVRDRFGDYGLVGVMLASRQGDALRVDSMLLSCRALGRGVEHRMAAFLAGHAESIGCAWVDFPSITTDRNEPARAFLRRLAASCDGRLIDNQTTRFSPALLRTHRYLPGENDPEGESGGEAAAATDGASPIADDHVISIARELRTADSIVSALMDRRRRTQATRKAREGARSVSTSPISDTEKAIAQAWKRALGLADVGTDDNFFEVGGTSMRLAQVAIDLNRHGMHVAIVDLFQYPTISALARHLSRPDTPKESFDTMATSGQRQRAMVGDQGLPAMFERLKRHRGK